IALPVQNINHSAFRLMFEREKLSRNNFNDWFRQLKFPGTSVAYNEVACLILGSMTPELHRQFENSSPYDMIKELKSMFEKQARVERFDLIQTFHACKQEEGKPVAAYVLQMKGYVDQLERLGYMLPHDLIVGLILNGLTKDFAGFVRNYNMHNMGKMIGELHTMLIEYEKGLPKKAETPQVMMIKFDKIQKANNKSLKAKGKGKANGKGKDKQVYIPKPKNPKPSTKEHPAKDDTCHHCKEMGHWKRNCPVYLAELIKKKKQVGTTSSSDVFIIELFFSTKSWVVCNTHSQYGSKKKVDKTPYELWYGKVPNLSYLKIWGCEALMKRDTPDKLQKRSVKCIFIGYPKETIGYYFYFPPENKIVVVRYAEFLEKNLISQEVSGRAEKLEEIQDKDTSPSENTSKNPMEVEGFEPPQKEVVPIRRSKWLFKKKTDKDDIIHTYKVRLVAKGYTQSYGIDYEEMFSPVAAIRAIRILIATTAFYDYEIWQIDVKTAFINGYLNEDIYMVQPKGFVDPDHPRKVCKLQRSIYGLKQASRS
ncbi:retrotransposon protein, putative, ty1-copia subclass, partial [Tanacetum coccineum]